MSESLMKSAHELKAYLAQRTILNPHSELEFLVELLESSELARLRGRAKLEMLEVLWPSIRGLLSVFERQVNGSWQKQSYSENSIFLDFERLAKLTQKTYSEAAVAMHTQSKPWWGEYPREIALTRALEVSVQIAVMRLSLYIPIETGYWNQVYALWHEAEHANLMEGTAKTQADEPFKSRLGEIFMGLSILGTLSTNALPSQEIKPLLTCFVKFSSKTKIHKTRPSSEEPWIGINFEHDIPPKRYIHSPQEETNTLNHALRFISLAPLVELIQTMLANFSGDFIYISECAVLISRATLEQVIFQFQHPLNLRRERPKAAGQCYVYSGMDAVTHLLRAGDKLGQFSPLRDTSSPTLIQEGIDTPPDATNLITDKPSDTPADELWELVGRGHLIYEAPQDKHATATTTSIKKIHQQSKLWNIVDISMDGMRLQGTRSKDEPALSIGSLVLVEFPKDMSIDYLVGILRWELQPSSTTQEIGIEALSHNAKPIRISGNHQDTSTWYGALILPPSRRAGYPLLVLPNQEYHLGSSVMAFIPHKEYTRDATNPNEPMRELILGHKFLQTTSICVFQFQDARDIAERKSNIDDTLGISS